MRKISLHVNSAIWMTVLLFFVCCCSGEVGYSSRQARQALNAVMELDGRGEAPESDSLARLAYSYYSHFGSIYDKMISEYCLAGAEYAQGDVTGAILHYHDALRHAERIRDERMEGYICQKMGELYAVNYNHEDAITYSSRAAGCLDAVGESLSADFSRIDMARQYLSLRNPDKADAIADSILSRGEPSDRGLGYFLYLLKADIAVAHGNEQDARYYYAKTEATGYTLPLISYGNYYFLSDTPKADSLMTVMLGNVKSGVDSMVFFEFLTEHSRLKGDYEQAYRNLSMVDKIQDRMYSSIISQSATRALKAYFEEQYNAEHQRRRAQMLTAALIILVLLIVIAIVFMFLKRRRLQVERELSRVEELSRDLRLMRAEAKRSDDIASELVHDKLRSMALLSEAYMNWSDDAVLKREAKQGRAGKEEIILQFRQELAELRSDRKFLGSIEEMLDRTQGGVMERLRKDFSGMNPGLPKFKEADFTALVLFFAGFSNPAISFYMDLTDDALRSRKKRYKQIFASMPDEDGATYLGLLLKSLGN